MKRKSIIIAIVLAILLAGCKKEDLPKEIRDKIPIDEIPPPIENEYFSVYVWPDTIKRGEGIYIGVDYHGRRKNDVYVTFPDPSDKNNTIRLGLDRYKRTSVWMMPSSWLYADGRVAYGAKPIADGAVEGDHAIYTPFDWDEDIIRIRIDDGSQDIWIEINVEGSLKDDIIVRPVDPRHPFPNGVSSIWKEHLNIFSEISDWWDDR